jgi:AraC-like DNA-binding protein
MEVGYRESAAPPDLRGAVACVWTRLLAPSGSRAPILPDGCVDLMWFADTGLQVAGPDTGPHPASLAGGLLIVAVRFLPGAGGPAFRQSLAELCDARVDAVDVIGAPALAVHGALDPDEALRRLLALTRHLVDAGPPDALVRAAATHLALPGATVDEVTRALAISPRHLRRRTVEAVGYGPKRLQRVLRFQQVLTALDTGTADLAGLAATLGYTDQAHLTTDVRLLAGLPPGALARSRRA